MAAAWVASGRGDYTPNEILKDFREGAMSQSTRSGRGVATSGLSWGEAFSRVFKAFIVVWGTAAVAIAFGALLIAVGISKGFHAGWMYSGGPFVLAGLGVIVFGVYPVALKTLADSICRAVGVRGRMPWKEAIALAVLGFILLAVIYIIGWALLFLAGSAVFVALSTAWSRGAAWLVVDFAMLLLFLVPWVFVGLGSIAVVLKVLSDAVLGSVNDGVARRNMPWSDAFSRALKGAIALVVFSAIAFIIDLILTFVPAYRFVFEFTFDILGPGLLRVDSLVLPLHILINYPILILGAILAMYVVGFKVLSDGVSDYLCGDNGHSNITWAGAIRRVLAGMIALMFFNVIGVATVGLGVALIAVAFRDFGLPDAGPIFFGVVCILTGVVIMAMSVYAVVLKVLTDAISSSVGDTIRDGPRIPA